MSSETDDGRQVGHLFDNNGNRTQLTWPDGYFIKYKYDALNRMTYALENGTTELASYNYDLLSRRNYACFGGQSSACQSGGGTNKTTYGYELDSDLSTVTHLLNTASVTLSYGHNHSHQITSVTTTDNFYLPTSATASTAYTPTLVNQYSTNGGNANQYDANGNLKTLFPSGGSQLFTYDTENRLISAAVGGSGTNSVFYDYDALERRITKTVGGSALGSGGTTTNYLPDGQEEIAELDGSGNILRRYIPGPAIDDRIAVAEGSSTISPTRTYFHVDHEGSVMAMTDATGNAIACAAGVNCQKLAYDEYGNLSSASTSTGEPYRFTGRRFDAETGMYYYRARYYSPSVGRFMQMDPIGSKDDLNLYAYVGNDPLDGTDPTGEDCVDRSTGPCETVTVTAQRPPPPTASAIAVPIRVPEVRPLPWWRATLATASAEILGDMLLSDCRGDSGPLPNCGKGSNTMTADAPKDAKDPNGAKAPGKPSDAEGFEDPKGGEKWAKGSDGRGGWVDSKGRIWQPTGPGSRAHGGPHWDVQNPDGTHTNVYPGGTTR